MEITGNSREVVSNQDGVHESLEKVVRKHLGSKFLRPYPVHAVEKFNALAEQIKDDPRPLIFDSCCGVGESTAKIAQDHPDSLVIGLDKSGHRLAKTPVVLPENALLLEVDLNDFWRLAASAGWKLQKHYILYPNPWPKSQHFQRRWHGGALFPTILELGGTLELRSNWKTYLDEFTAALEIAGHTTAVEEFGSSDPITPFERKYQASGQKLWRMQVQL